MPYPWLTESWRHLVRLSGDLPHALLIHGLRGIGKQALAMAFARFLLCETPTQALTSCGVCAGCRLLAADTHPDLRRVQPEFLDEDLTESATDTNRAKRSKTTRPSQEIKIDQIRELADFLNLGSHRGGRRIAIVQPAEDMNPNAANALLKGLEAPPPGAFFLLVSDEPARLLATVRSRCIGVPIAKPDRRSAESWLKEQHLEGGEVSNWLSLA